MQTRLFRPTPRISRHTRHANKACTAYQYHRYHRRFFTVLALESSADDTCAAVVNSNRQILSNIVVKQHNVHEKFGGIYVYEAIASHQKNLPGAIRQALADAKLDASNLDGIAFTRGPGMRACLSVCSNAGKSLAAALNKPLVGVHHMQAHALTPFLALPTEEHPKYPFLTLLVSGGHTLLLLAFSSTRFQTLATTHDISIGNAYDRVSRLLGIKWDTYGPGAALEKFCADNPVSLDPLTADIKSSVPNRGQLMFSYSGMYAAFQRYIESLLLNNELTHERKVEIAWAFQYHAARQLEEKLLLGLKRCENRGYDIRDIVVSGGVASNLYLRARLRFAMNKAKGFEVSFAFPPLALCTDNAAMIAWASMERFIRGDHDPYDIELQGEWNIEDLSK